MNLELIHNLKIAAWFVICTFVLCVAGAAAVALIQAQVPLKNRRAVVIGLLAFLLIVLLSANKF
jgi:hypothetical protein